MEKHDVTLTATVWARDREEASDKVVTYLAERGCNFGPLVSRAEAEIADERLPRPGLFCRLFGSLSFRVAA